ncbi:rhodanese-like domain-containing protein [Micromonospora sp. CPCC 206061]|uniref:rhodanese-like domain-containing protein n=1 Tax=Micromonospora sp. CPCC 206061 TaxID=3122410 RepID=UPI002FF1940D
MPDTITREELQIPITDGAAVVVDALPAAPYGRRHLPGAVNLVIDDADDRAPAVLPDRSATVVTYSTNDTCGRGEALADRRGSKTGSAPGCPLSVADPRLGISWVAHTCKIGD